MHNVCLKNGLSLGRELVGRGRKEKENTNMDFVTMYFVAHNSKQRGEEEGGGRTKTQAG